MTLIGLGTTAVLCAIVAGCGSTPVSPNSPTSGPTPAEVAAAQFTVESSVSIGTAEVLQSNPQYKPDFVLGGQVLLDLSKGTNTITTAEIESALAASGETNPIIEMTVVNALGAVNSYIQGSNSDPTVQNQELQTVLFWIAAGMSEGIGNPPMTLKRKYVK